MATNPPPDRATTARERLAAKVAAAADRFPQVERALRKERAALEVASAVSDLLESARMSIHELSARTGIAVQELGQILAADSDARVTVATLADIASALNYRFGFSFAPKSMSVREAIDYVSGAGHVVDAAAPQVDLND